MTGLLQLDDGAAIDLHTPRVLTQVKARGFFAQRSNAFHTSATRLS